MLNVGLNAVTQDPSHVAGLVPPRGRKTDWLDKKEAADRTLDPTAALASTNGLFPKLTESSSSLKKTVNEDRVIVLGKLSSEDTSWLQDISPGYVLLRAAICRVEVGHIKIGLTRSFPYAPTVGDVLYTS